MVEVVSVNLWAVLVAGIVNMVIGFLWYGPVFGKTWMKLSGITSGKIDKAKQKGMALTYLIGFVSALIMAYVLAYVSGFASSMNWIDGLLIGFLVWIGFIATSMLGIILWEGKSVKLYVLNSGYYLVVLLINAVIISVWK